MPRLTVDPEVRALVTAAVVESGRVRVGPASERLVEEIDRLCAGIRSSWGGRPPGEIEGLAPARRLFRAFGIDPTSTRPASEALVRRVLQGRPFPRVNAAVEVCNLCSVTFLLPIGLYDAGKIRGDVTLRRGAAGESYAGIRKDAVSVAGRPVLEDDEGPFGNPSSDSLRTCVTEATEALFMVIFAPSDYPAAALEAHRVFAREAMERHLRDGNPPGGAVLDRKSGDP
ncbi:MAG TPA: phenylalanine--tRNA ligase beta subunit-related protein [Candidatus Polarisedimenticolaceae bacterium]|nr:phenylalanine--tRNA ligase beta subunit-related protein [Candidatus Polarisedimenticolaceae bacterium]